MPAYVPFDLFTECVYADANDPVWVLLLEQYDPQAITDAILAGLNQDSNEEFGIACGFIRAFARIATDPDRQALVRQVIHQPPVSDRLCTLLNDSAFIKRKNAVQVLGNLGARDALPQLQDTFERRVDSDPLLISDLVSEIGWLASSVAPRVTCIQRCLGSASPLSRWAGLGVTHQIAQYSEDES